MQNIIPQFDYVYGEKVEDNSGVVTTTEISDTHQTFKVLAIGDGHREPSQNDSRGFTLMPMPCKVGDIVLVQKHAAEGDTPPKMLSGGYALFQGSRVMAVLDEA